MQGTIIGVFNEFSATNLRTQTPLVAIRCKSNGSYLPYAYVRINSANTAGSLQFIAGVFKKHFPQEGFDFSFVDERVAAQYQTEIRLTQLINAFTILSIALLVLGLFSLVSLMVRRRTKEIGIRKVLGASVSSILVLIGKEFIVLILLALAIGAPVAHFATTKWLEGYAYRTNISWWFFGLSAFITILIVLLSIGSRSFSAAMANPVKSLRTE
ncbi:FtsX-like permease family protein [Agriterribacter sp.]|uniref:ABC transporter permease n=1 Tax=Agriterribacter sp. TaxID=2821509 RepID=UPI002C9548CF|nr:FtsX-like permease family protein [Agriterribacter sp.]HRP54861.1 FtsX-like permease family protein [Agriterribacter sp.]